MRLDLIKSHAYAKLCTKSRPAGDCSIHGRDFGMSMTIHALAGFQISHMIVPGARDGRPQYRTERRMSRLDRHPD
jgi:hypothetical protein